MMDSKVFIYLFALAAPPALSDEADQSIVDARYELVETLDKLRQTESDFAREGLRAGNFVLPPMSGNPIDEARDEALSEMELLVDDFVRRSLDGEGKSVEFFHLRDTFQPREMSVDFRIDNLVFDRFSLQSGHIEDMGRGKGWWNPTVETEGSVEADSALVVSEDGMEGIVWIGQDIFEIRKGPYGVHAAVLLERTSNMATLISKDDVDTLPEAPDPLDDGNAQPGCDIETDAPIVLGVAVAYTKDAATSALAEGHSIIALIEVATSIANTVLKQSGISAVVRFASDPVEVNAESGFGILDEEIELIRQEDESIEPLLSLRETTKSDVMILVANRENSVNCGRAARIGPRADESFVAVNWRCMRESRMSYIHELGHLFGSWHNLEALSSEYHRDAGTSVGALKTLHAESGIGLATVMAYWDSCAELGLRCARIPRVSGPEVKWQGVATGSQREDNRCVWAEGIRKIAGFGEGS